jgi:hypothetical protein
MVKIVSLSSGARKEKDADHLPERKKKVAWEKYSVGPGGPFEK